MLLKRAFLKNADCARGKHVNMYYAASFQTSVRWKPRVKESSHRRSDAGGQSFSESGIWILDSVDSVITITLCWVIDRSFTILESGIAPPYCSAVVVGSEVMKITFMSISLACIRSQRFHKGFRRGEVVL